MNKHYATGTQHLANAVLHRPGETQTELREAVKEQAYLLGLKPGATVSALPSEIATFVKKIALYAYKVTDEDVDALRTAGYSEDAIFEITLSAALGASLVRLEQGLAAMKENQ